MTDDGRPSREDLANIALAAAKEGSRQTLNETFALMGVNLMNFDDMKEFREDLDFVRSMRTGVHKVSARVGITIITTITGALAIAIWEALKSLAIWEYLKSIVHL
jgi:hypothetical protein